VVFIMVAGSGRVWMDGWVDGWVDGYVCGSHSSCPGNSSSIKKTKREGTQAVVKSVSLTLTPYTSPTSSPSRCTPVVSVVVAKRKKIVTGTHMTIARRSMSCGTTGPWPGGSRAGPLQSEEDTSVLRLQKQRSENTYSPTH
jgi:hypothetical protein